MSERQLPGSFERERSPRGRPSSPLVTPDPHEIPLALPAPGTATALASGAAGPARPPRRGPGEGAPDGRGPRAQHPEEGIPHDLKRPETFWVIVVLAGMVVMLVVLFAVGLLPRLAQTRELDADAKRSEAPPRVNVMAPWRAQARTDLELPGDVLAWRDTGVYARITGYVKRWNVDIGDRVKEGQVLALIDAPDIDQQLNQAKAQLGQSRATLLKAEADFEYNQVQLQRFSDLRKINAISPQQLDQQQDATESARSALEQTKANIAQQQANVRQLTQQQDWEKVVAPFDGRITARNIDVGTLIMPGTTALNSGGGKEMFHVVETDVLRVMITVPQTFVDWIRQGQPAKVYFRDKENEGILGRVSRYSGALDPSTRTLLTEVDVPNADEALRPGTSMLVRFSVSRNHPPLMVPESALIFNADNTQLAVVERNGAHTTSQFVPVVVGRMLNADVEILSGLAPDAQVVVNPGERMVSGGPIDVNAVLPPPKREAGPGDLGTPGATPFTLPTSAPILPTTPATGPAMLTPEGSSPTTVPTATPDSATPSTAPSAP